MDREIQDSIQSSRQLIHIPPTGSAGTLRPTIPRRIKMPAVGRRVSPSREGEWRIDRENQDSIQPSRHLIHIPPTRLSRDASPYLSQPNQDARGRARRPRQAAREIGEWIERVKIPSNPLASSFTSLPPAQQGRFALPVHIR